MSKKILSFALAVVMLISVFAFSASAAAPVTTVFPTEGQIGYRVVSNAYVGMPAGSTVTVKVFHVVPDSLDLETYRQGSGNIVLCYNSDYYTVDAESRVWGAPYEAMKPAAKINDLPTFWTNTVSKQVTVEGYNAAVLVALAWNTELGYSASTGFVVDPYTELFSINFTTNKTLDENAILGIDPGTVGKTTTSSYRDTVNKKTIQYKENIVVSEGSPDAPVVAVNEYADLKIRNNAADANKVDLGITGEFKNVSFPVEFGANGTTCTNLSAIGVQVRMNGTIVTADCDGDLNYIYPTADGYKFRAAVTGIDAAGLDSKVEVRVYMVTDNGTYYSNWMGCSARAAYTNAVAGGMSAIA